MTLATSGYGTKRTLKSALLMSAYWVTADIAIWSDDFRF
jgi:hypothetical protein